MSITVQYVDHMNPDYTAQRGMLTVPDTEPATLLHAYAQATNLELPPGEQVVDAFVQVERTVSSVTFVDSWFKSNDTKLIFTW